MDKKERPGAEAECNDLRQMQRRLLPAVSRRISELSDIWMKMGLPAEMRETRVRTVEREIKALLQTMVTEELQHLAALHKEIAKWRNDLSALAKELQAKVLHLDQFTSPVVGQAVGLLDVEKELRREVRRLTSIKAEAVLDLGRLVDQDRRLSAALDLKPFPIAANVVPSEGQLLALKRHIEHMEDMKRQRWSRFRELKTHILSVCEELGKQPDATVCNPLKVEDESSLSLSAEFMASLETQLMQLTRLRDSQMREAEQVQQRIIRLADELDVTEEARFRHCSSSADLTELKATLRELEQMKLGKLRDLIREAKLELEEWWERCLYDQDRRLQLRHSSHGVEEDELQQLQAELIRVKQHYEENATLFELIDECQKLWQIKVQLDTWKDPSRLNDYKRLAQEEKERTLVKKRLPRLEKQLFQRLSAYQEQYGMPLRVQDGSGLPFQQFWCEQKQLHERQLQRLREARKVLRKVQVHHDALFGTSPTPPRTPVISSGRRQHSATHYYSSEEDEQEHEEQSLRNPGRGQCTMPDDLLLTHLTLHNLPQATPRRRLFRTPANRGRSRSGPCN